LTTKGQILKSASVIALATAISRICGYLRDQRIALLLGTSPAADAFIVVFRIPGVIRRMFAEGALSASFIPVFTDYLRNKPRQEAWRFAQKIFWDTAIVLAAIAVLGCLGSRQLVYAFTILRAHQSPWDLAIFLNRIIFPCVVFLGAAGMAAAILNSFHVFAIPASTSIFFNLVVIACTFGAIYRPIMRWGPQQFQTPAVALAAGILVGAALQLALQIPALHSRGMRFTPMMSFGDAGVRQVGRLMGPSIFGMGVYQINVLVDTMFGASSRMPSGTVMSLYIGDRLMQLVLGSYAIAMSTALLPAMAHQAAAGQFEEMKRTFAFSLRIVSFVAIPAAVGLILLRRPIIQVLFQHGQFNSESTALTARALLYYALGLPAFAAIKLVTPMYYSAQDAMTPARVAAWTLGLNVAMNAVFLLWLFRYLSNGGPALASSLAAYFNVSVLYMIFRRRFGRLGAPGTWKAIGKMAASAAVMGLLLAAAMRVLQFESGPQLLLRQAAWLVSIIGVSVAAYFGCARLLRCDELGELLLLLRRTGPASAASAAGLDI
jgi:putative peptidoglycan lipid II flippase